MNREPVTPTVTAGTGPEKTVSHIPYRAVQRIGAVPHARQCAPTPNQESGWVLVREGGFEPPRPFGHRILSPARLPGSATLAGVKPKYRQGYSRVGYQGREPEA
jgi:hypothetical protein